MASLPTSCQQGLILTGPCRQKGDMSSMSTAQAVPATLRLWVRSSMHGDCLVSSERFCRVVGRLPPCSGVQVWHPSEFVTSRNPIIISRQSTVNRIWFGAQAGVTTWRTATPWKLRRSWKPTRTSLRLSGLVRGGSKILHQPPQALPHC